jgi:hypothetical protein
VACMAYGLWLAAVAAIFQRVRPGNVLTLKD